MSGVKSYFKQKPQWKAFGLEHAKMSDFYLSVWQTTRSPLPLLIIRTLLLLGSIAVVVGSMIFYKIYGKLEYWIIYLTYWGLLWIVVANFFSVFVSARAYFGGPISADFKLPWYVKVQWVSYNSAIPVSFLITIFYTIYWVFLLEDSVKRDNSQVLNIAVHIVNSLIIFILLITSSEPSRLAHLYQPMLFAMVYIVFNILYCVAGGTDELGNNFIYPVMDWANPAPAIGLVVGTAFFLIVLHAFTVHLANLRDSLAQKLINPSVKVYIDEERWL